MLGYLKLKTVNEELYETDFLSKIKEKKTKLSGLQYWICHIFFEAVVKLKYLANIITVKQIYQSYLFIFPFQISQNEIKEIGIFNKLLRKKILNRKINKCIKNLFKLIKKYQIDTLVLSEEMETLLEINKNKIYTFAQNQMLIDRKIHFLDGRGLMPYLIKEIIEYILEKQKTKTEVMDLYLCMKEAKTIYIENISYLAQYFRTINVVTPSVGSLQRVANKIEAKGNGMITVTNNKKKSLKKAKIIINFDLTEQEMKKYSIYRRAIILFIKSEQYESIGFDGIQIQQLSIDTSPELKEFFQKYHLLGECNLTTLYESLINEKQGFTKVKAQIQKDKVKIVKLHGKKGEIQEKEYIEKAG